MPRPKKVLFWLITIFVSLTAAFAAGEVLLRVLGYHGAPVAHIDNIHEVDDPVVDWRYNPNSELRMGAITYKYNSKGFRDTDHSMEKRRGIERVLVVGDSVSEGYGVKWESVFASVLQDRLGRDYEVINVAASGMNAPQAVHLLEREGVSYQPEVAVVNFILNDADFYSNIRAAKEFQASKAAEIGLLGITIDPNIKRLLKSSSFIYFVSERLNSLKARFAGNEDGDYYSVLWSQEKNRNRVTEAFDKLSSLRETHGLRVIVAIWPLLTEYGNYPFEDIHEWVKKESDERGFETVDLLPFFSEFPYEELKISVEDSVHPNALGHRVAADAVFSQLMNTNQ